MYKNKLEEIESFVEVPEKSIKIGQGQDWTNEKDLNIN